MHCKNLLKNMIHNLMHFMENILKTDENNKKTKEINVENFELYNCRKQHNQVFRKNKNTIC